MSNIEIVVRTTMLIMGLCLLLIMVVAAHCAWVDFRGRKQAKVYRERQLSQLQMLREERDREDARRDRIRRDSVRFGSSNHPRVWRQEAQSSPPAQPFDDDFGGTMAPRRFGHHDTWEPDLPPHVAVTATGGSFERGGR